MILKHDFQKSSLGAICLLQSLSQTACCSCPPIDLEKNEGAHLQSEPLEKNMNLNQISLPPKNVCIYI